MFISMKPYESIVQQPSHTMTNQRGLALCLCPQECNRMHCAYLCSGGDQADADNMNAIDGLEGSLYCGAAGCAGHASYAETHG